MKIQTWGPKEDFDHQGRWYAYFAEALGTDGKYHIMSFRQAPSSDIEVQENCRKAAAASLKQHMFVKGVWQDTWDDLSVEEVRSRLLSNDVGHWELHEGSFDPNDWGDLGPVEHVASVGGSEGSGELMYYVLKCGSRYFRQEGYYASWDGSRWDGKFREVQGVERTIVVWEDK